MDTRTIGRQPGSLRHPVSHGAVKLVEFAAAAAQPRILLSGDSTPICWRSHPLRDLLQRRFLQQIQTLVRSIGQQDPRNHISGILTH
jgi:hypothetical protein